MQRTISAMMGILVLAACSESGPRTGEVLEREGQPDVIRAAEDDPVMNAAMDEARATAPQFVRALTNPTPVQVYFSVKGSFTDGEEVEFIWINDVAYNNGIFAGTIGNEPVFLASPKLGDAVEVPQNEIADWMIVDDGRLRGGYTLRVLRDRMTTEDREAFDRWVPFTFGS